jgi:Uma2 family endonuclease
MSHSAPAIPTPIQASAIPADYTIAPLTVEQYHAMARAGILEEGAPIELLEGYLVEKMTKHPPHSVATQLTQDAIRRVLPLGWRTITQDPITLVDSEPEPDVAVVRGDARRYLARHPGPTEVALVVEIADSSLAVDRGAKRRIYARAGIPVYWLVNLVDRFVECYAAPVGPARNPLYTATQVYAPGDHLPFVIDGVEAGSIAVDDILP